METTTYFCNKHRQMKKIVFGLLLVAAGALLLCFNYGIIPMEYRHIIFSWPMILVAIGLLQVSSRESIFTGIILILIGGFFLLPRLFFMPQNFIHDFWPGLLIIFGILIILKRSFFHHGFHGRRYRNVAEMKNDAGFIVMNNVLGGGKHVVAPVEFKGGKISNIFGGMELDLTQTTLAPGKNILEIDSIFGGISIIVPSDWVIKIEVSSTVGGFSDKRTVVPDPASGADRELIIRGSAIFGGGDIKC